MSTGQQARYAVLRILWVGYSLAMTSTALKSPTMDEGNHIARGSAYLGMGDRRLSVENPPL
jgi:hypothetical protein